MSVPASPSNPVHVHQSLLDLDEALEALLTRELEAVGIRSVAITFEAPDRERTATWPSPALNLFLYDIRESGVARDRSWRADGLNGLRRGALRLECSYAITAWTKAVRDEHQLLSQVLAILLAHPAVPAEFVTGDLAVGDPPAALPTRVAHGKAEGRAEFWTAIGSAYKLSLEYEVTAFVESAQQHTRAPQVERAAVLLHSATAADSTLTQGGTVAFRDGRPADGAVVVVPGQGLAALVDASGNFTLTGVAPGSHSAFVRDVSGRSHPVTIQAPGAAVGLVLDT
ncbi:MAG: hypothetical protein JWQ20_4081 [Conexibacter sp.]|nr:hypothetical protein [Solirubrobacterales bacterium]MCW3004783.1 hypothetical protein [Conexibacter sp.]